MPLPQQQGPQLAEIIAAAFHEYPPFRQYIHAGLDGADYRAAMLESFGFYVDLAFAGEGHVWGATGRGRLLDIPACAGNLDGGREWRRRFA